MERPSKGLISSGDSVSTSSCSSAGSSSPQNLTLIHQQAVRQADSVDLYSFQEGSYNEWKYGDEASLYSIAEDSREDRMSEVPSMAGTDATSVRNGRQLGAGQLDDDDDDPTIEVCWTAGGQGARVVLDQPAPERLILPREEHDDGGDGDNNGQVYGYEPRGQRRRQYFVSACVICLAVVAVVLGVTLSQGGNDRARGSVGDGIAQQEDDQQQQQPEPAPPVPAPAPGPRLPITAPTAPTEPSSPQVVAAPAQVPPPEPTASPTHSPMYTLARTFVINAINVCPGSAYQRWNDPNTMQAEALESIVQELVDRMTKSNDGFINFPLEYGVDYLREKYALEMLYKSTEGYGWWAQQNWMTEMDPCKGWHGVDACRKRREGSCGVLQVNLNANNLSGSVPEEICCLPCVQSLSLAGNRISGAVPQCLLSMKAELNLKNNLLAPEVEALVVATTQRSATTP